MMRRYSPLLAASLGVYCLAPPAYAVILRHDRAEADSLALGKRFAAAGQVLPDGGCTLIAPRWAVTAAHVARDLKPGVGRVRFAEKEYTVIRIHTHPDSQAEHGRPPGVDLALLELKQDVEGIAPFALYEATEELAQTIFIVGYGDVGDGRSAPKRSDGKRRAVTNIVTDAGPLRLFCKFDLPPNGTELEGVGGPGDSGGPALIERNGTFYLAGVSSASMNGQPGRYGVMDVYTRVSSFANWIRGIVEGATGTGR